MSSKPIVHDEFASPASDSPALRLVSETPVPMPAEQLLKNILVDVLGLASKDADAFTSDSGLFGHLPELDSMAVAGLLTEIEDRFDIVIEDDDVDGEMLETFGGLLAFVKTKQAEG